MTGARRGEQAPVLESKLRAPRMPATTVPRTRLLNTMAIAEHEGRTAIVVSAPAGAGKTVLLAQRCEDLRSAGTPVAWLSLDDGDNDPMRLWSGILAACARALRTGDGSVPAEIQALRPPADPADTSFLAAWHDAIEPLDQRLWLILDDVHEVTEHSSLDVLARLLRTAPPWLRLVLGSRQDMPLPIPRMVLAGTASEIRSADLAFSADEARELLSGHGVELGDSDLRLLLARTEGWAAGLKLAALSLNQQDDFSSYIAAFAGDDRPVADYLVHEVLARQKADVRDFLLTTSIPEQLTAELAAELTGRVDSGSVLDRLAHDNVFTYQQDTSPRLYTYHPLLRSYLQAELSYHDAPAIRRLHARTADWFAARDIPAKALSHSVAARDWSRAADLIDQQGLRLLLAGDSVALQRALAAVPDEVLTDPRVALVAAAGALQDGDVTVAERHLGQVGRNPTKHADPRLRLLHTTALIHEARLRGDCSPRVQALVEETRTISTNDLDLTLLVTANRGVMLAMLGDLAGAHADLTTAQQLARKHHRDLLALECLSYLALSAAAPAGANGMRTHAQEAIEFATARGWASSVPVVRSYLAAAWGAWEEMDRRDAERWVELAAGIDANPEPPITTSIRILNAHVRYSRTGDSRELAGRLRAAWEHPGAVAAAPAAIGHYCLAELRAALPTADKGWTDGIVARARNLLGDDAGDVFVLEAMVDAHHGRDAAARRRLSAVLDGRRPCRTTAIEITCWLLEADLTARAEPTRAHNAVVRALELAAPLRAVRQVASAPPSVRKLLVHGKGRFGHHDRFVGEVLAASHQAEDAPDDYPRDQPLTARELEVLRDLQSLQSVDEIAESQAVSVNTVKTHLKALYRKFDVGSRREAVERARELGLL